MARKRGKRGAGTIVEREGRYQAQWSGGRDGNGKRLRRTATFGLYRDAEWWLREAEREGKPPDVDVTVEEYLSRWLASLEHVVRPTTLQGYEIHVRLWIVPQIGHLALVRVNLDQCERVRDAVLQAGRTRRTAQAVMTTMRMAFGAAVRRGELDRNVAANVQLPRRQWAKVEGTTEDDARRIIEAFEDHPLRPIVVLAIGSGMRLGEILALRWTDLVKDYVRITGSIRPTPKPGGGRVLERIDPKTPRSVRAIRLDQFVLDELAEHRRRQAEGGRSAKVFPGRGDAWRDPTAVRQTFQRVLAAHGVPRMRFHDLRHAYATLALAHDVPLRTISQRLGHSNVAITASVYTHILPEMVDSPAKVEHLLQFMSGQTLSAPEDVLDELAEANFERFGSKIGSTDA